MIKAILACPETISSRLSKSVRNSGYSKAADLLRYPHFVGGVIAQFLYVAAQIGTWSYFIQYVQDYAHQSEKVAGYSFDRESHIIYGGKVYRDSAHEIRRPKASPGIYSLISIALVGTGILLPGWVGVGALFMTSLFKSPMFPTIFALGVKELGPNSKLGGSIMVMAIVGGAVPPPVMGLIFRYTHSMATAMLVP